MPPATHPTPAPAPTPSRARLAAGILLTLVLPACAGLTGADEDLGVPLTAESSSPTVPPAPPAVEPREDGRLADYPTVIPHDLPPSAETARPPAGTASPTPDEEPNEQEPSEQEADLRAQLDALRALDQPAEVLLPAVQQDQITNPLHARWYNAWGPAGFTNPEWEWSNKAELWDQIVDLVWEDAVQRYGDRLYDKHGTVWPGSNTSSYAVWGWSGHHESGGYGHIGQVRVGLDPAQAGQRRPDVGLYMTQIRVTEEGPDLFRGELHRIAPPFKLSGELVWPDQTTEAIQSGSQSDDTWVYPADLPNDDGWEVVNPEYAGG